MKKLMAICLGLLLLAIPVGVFAQKIIAEGTIVYDLEIQTGNTVPRKGEEFSGAKTTVYLKGNNSRSEMVSFLGNETTIHNAKSGSAVILKEFSGQKLMITLTKENWVSRNKGFSGTRFEFFNEVKMVAGYTCKKATAIMPDGKSFTVYYSPDVMAANKEYDPTFANLPGLAMQYEIALGKMKVNYTLSKINFDPVLIAKFDFPTAGYRVMTYDENQVMKKGD